MNPNKEAEMISTGNITDEKIQTDVVGVESDGTSVYGLDKYPLFDVNKDDFFRNMGVDRRRLRFASGSKAQQYHAQSRYNRPFYIRWTDDNGNAYKRKIK